MDIMKRGQIEGRKAKPKPRAPEDPGRGEVVHEQLAHALARVLDVLDAVVPDRVEDQRQRVLRTGGPYIANQFLTLYYIVSLQWCTI